MLFCLDIYAQLCLHKVNMGTVLAKKIRKRMIDADVTGAEIARKAGVHRSSINKTIGGTRKSFRLRKAIADALHLKVKNIWPEDRKSL